jgi:hypothetical protein
MPAWLIGAIVGAAAGLMVLPFSASAVPEPVPVAAAPDFDGLGTALMIVGACSVLCSLIWGCAIIIASRNRRGREKWQG